MSWGLDAVGECIGQPREIIPDSNDLLERIEVLRQFRTLLKGLSAVANLLACSRKPLSVQQVQDAPTVFQLFDGRGSLRGTIQPIQQRLCASIVKHGLASRRFKFRVAKHAADQLQRQRMLSKRLLQILIGFKPGHGSNRFAAQLSKRIGQRNSRAESKQKAPQPFCRLN